MKKVQSASCDWTSENTWLVCNIKPRVLFWLRAQDYRACDASRGYLGLATLDEWQKNKTEDKTNRKTSTAAPRRVAQSWSAYCCPFKLGYPHVAIAVTPSYWRNSAHVVLLALYGRSRNCLRHCWRQSTPMRQVTSHVAPGIDLPLWRHLSSLAFRLTLSGAVTTRGNALPLLPFTPAARDSPCMTS